MLKLTETPTEKVFKQFARKNYTRAKQKGVNQFKTNVIENIHHGSDFNFFRKKEKQIIRRFLFWNRLIAFWCAFWVGVILYEISK